MASNLDSELVAFAERYRCFLPDGFQEEIDVLKSELAQQRSIVPLRAKGRGSRRQSNVSIRAAILQELSLFLCTDDARYADLRGNGRKLTKEVVQFMAGVIVGLLGVASGVATACVAFLALACARIGLGTFCRLNPPPSKTK